MSQVRMVWGLFLVLHSAVSHGGWFAAEFSAEMVQAAPQQPEATARLYVGATGVRTEFEKNGRELVQIIVPEERISWLISPKEKTYEIHHLPSLPPELAAMAVTPVSPCSTVATASCRRVGTERVGGREAEKWHVTHQRDATRTMQVWVDKDHRFVLRQTVDGELTFERRFIGIEQRDGRQLEKWESSSRTAAGRLARGHEWYDPELHVATRQELPGAYVRELRDIRAGKQPEELFQIPSGYRKVEALRPAIPNRSGLLQ